MTLVLVLGPVVFASAARARSAAEVAERYAAVVAAWAEEPTSEVVTELDELLSGSGAREGVLHQAIQRLDRRLIGHEPGARLALAQLHGLTHLALLRRWVPDPTVEPEDDPVALAARLTEDRISRLLAGLGAEESAVVARAWAALGHMASLLPPSHTESAAGLFGRALQRDPHNVAALHGLAFLEERRGERSAAAIQLRRLLEVEPGHAEARLRLALVLARGGNEEEALEGLAGVVAKPAPDWVQSLAYQELIQLSDDPDQARRWSDEALRRFPDDTRLRLQRAHLERDDWRASTRRVVQLFEAWRPSQEPSPRLLYDFGPRDDRKALLTQVEADLAASLEALRRALAASEHGPGQDPSSGAGP